MPTVSDLHTASPGVPLPQGAAEDVAFCIRLLPQVSRTFALSIEALPEGLREPVRVAYLLCRVVDTIEDEHVLPWRERERLFDVFDATLESDVRDPKELTALLERLALGTDAERELCANADRVFRRFRAQSKRQRDAMRQPIVEMSRGMREFTARAETAGKLRLSSCEELERYCYFVAGTVGELLTALFEQQVPSLTPEARRLVRDNAVSFGLGLQLVNIVKDVASDYPRGDCYLPTDLAEARGLDLERLLDPDQRPAGLQVLRAVCALARGHLQRAAQYTLAWPLPEGLPVRVFCVVPLALAFSTLWEVEHGPQALRPGGEPKVKRQTVYRLVADANKAVKQDAALASFLAQCAEGTYGESPRATAWAGGGEAAGTGGATSPGSGGLEAGSGRFSGKVLVTGAAGHLGANLVRRLLELGYEVRTLLRAGSNNVAVEGLNVERVYGDLTNPESLARATSGCESVYHCAAKVSTIYGNAAHKDEIYQSNVIGTRNLLRAARDAGVTRVVVTGSFSAVGYDPRDPSTPSSEEKPFYPFERTLPYAHTKVLVEHESLRAVAEGQDVVIATSCAIVGPHDYKPSRMGKTLIDFAHGRLPAYIPGGFEFVAARDIAEGHVLAMHRGRTGQKYTISTEFLTFDDVMDIFEEVTGRRRPALRLPPRLMGAMAEVSSLVLSNFFPRTTQLITPGAVRILRMKRRADISKAKEELGYRPTSVRQAIHEAFDDFARRGLVPASRTMKREAAPAPDAGRGGAGQGTPAEGEPRKENVNA